MKNNTRNIDPAQKKTSSVEKISLTTQEYDFEKLGQELHDGVNPLLSAALLYLHMIKTTGKRGKELKETAKTILLETVGYIRHLSADLVLPETGEKNLKLLVEKHVERINKIGILTIQVDFDETSVLSCLTEVEVIHLYRIIQEQITFQHIGILSLEFHVDKLSRPLL